MKTLPLIALFLFVCCSSAGQTSRAEREHSEVWYVNLKVIVDSLVAEDPEWKIVVKRIFDLTTRKNELEHSSPDAADSEKRIVNDELSSLEKKGEGIKRRIYPLIDRAIKEVARRNDVSVVINSIDLLYADMRFDMTGEVLSEARSIKMRNDPLSR
ncbi:MAG TPA: hypothetical protein VF857_01585 [Spirochaetota bacterium]